MKTVVGGLSERRVVLWRDALAIARVHPVRGAGPGGFSRLSLTAQADRDARFAHHEFLQHAAEFGFPGAVLMMSCFAWGFALLLLAPRPGSLHVTAAIGLAALGVHASVDYVLHFAAVPLAASALVATAASVTTAPAAVIEPRRPAVRPRPRPRPLIPG